MKTVDRLAEVCRSKGTVPVSPLTTLTWSSGVPELVGDDLLPQRARALAHVRGAGVDDRAAVGQQPHEALGQAGGRARA